jgi:hypothetical protein
VQKQQSEKISAVAKIHSALDDVHIKNKICIIIGESLRVVVRMDKLALLSWDYINNEGKEVQQARLQTVCPGRRADDGRSGKRALSPRVSFPFPYNPSSPFPMILAQSLSQTYHYVIRKLHGVSLALENSNACNATYWEK